MKLLKRFKRNTRENNIDLHSLEDFKFLHKNCVIFCRIYYKDNSFIKWYDDFNVIKFYKEYNVHNVIKLLFEKLLISKIC